jgi:hypothetical protein
MSSLRVDTILSTGGSSPNVENGFIVPASVPVTFGDYFKAGGTITAGFVVGDGSGLTNTPGLTHGDLFALTSIL